MQHQLSHARVRTVALLLLQGLEELPERLSKLRAEYQGTFVPYLMQQREAAQKKKLREQQEQLERFKADSTSAPSGSISRNSSSSSSRPATAADSVKRADTEN